MKKIICIFILIAVIFAGDRLFSRLISTLVLKSGTKFSTTYRGGQTNQIVILGNSRGNSSFSPLDIANSTGLTTFQLSHKGISTKIIECLWLDYLANNSPPEILILEITNISDTNKAIYDLKPYIFWSDNFSNLLKKENRNSYLATKISNLYIWNGEILFRSLYFIGKTDQNKNIHYNKKLNFDTLQTLLSLKKKNCAEISILPENIASLNRIIKVAHKYNIIVHLIFPPFVPQYVELICNSKNAFINLLSNNFDKNVFVHDMSDAISDITMFEDLTHLNYNGSKFLLNLILEKNILPRSSEPSIAANNWAIGIGAN